MTGRRQKIVILFAGHVVEIDGGVVVVLPVEPSPTASVADRLFAQAGGSDHAKAPALPRSVWRKRRADPST